MYYSKRQLYALGEPLGDFVTQRKAGGGMIYGGGGGGSPSGGGSTNTTVTNTNIPDYAQPYVSNMLNATQAQIYNKDMTGFNNYVPYSTNPTDYVAGFSPLQQQAQSSAANLQVPGQYNAATQLGSAAGIGALGTTGQAAQYGQQGSQAGQYGQNMSNMYAGQGVNAGMNAAGQSSMYGGLAANQGQQGANIGQSLGQMSTNPGAVQSYMNPYLQNSLNPQLQLAAQQYGMQGAAQQGAATSAGAFGGSRNALMQGLNQQNQMLAQNQIIGNGYNTAFNQAQNQMNAANQAALSGNAQALQGYNTGLQGAGQAGSQAMQGIGLGLQGTNQAANLGIAGAQAGLSGVGAQQAGYAQAGNQASNLSNIGSQQLAAQQGIIGTQSQQGGIQQGQQQNVINQAVQNYATAQQYPFMQLGQLNAMLRGLPMQQSSTQMYQSAPSTVSQLSGLGIAGLGASSMYNAATKAKGGKITAMATGGAVPMKMMNDDQLGQVQHNPISSPMAKINAQGLEQLHGYMHNNPQAAQMMQQSDQPMPSPQQMAQAPQNRSGVGAIGTGDMTQMAGGGIIAFADEGEVKDPSIPRTKSGELDWASILAPRLAEEQSGKNSVTQAYKPLAATQQEDIKQQKAMLMPEMATRFGLGLMNSQGGRGGTLLNKTLQDVGVSGLGAVNSMTSNVRDINAAKKQLQAGTIESTKADQQRADQLTGVLAQVYGSEQAKKIGLAQAAATRATGLDAKQAALVNSASSNYATQVKGAFDEMAKLQKNSFALENNPQELWNEARRQVYETLPQQTRDLLQLAAPKAAVVPPPVANNNQITPTPVPSVNPNMPSVPSIPKVTGQKDYEKITPGTVYIDPNGVQRTKPLA
jgi:hypothetical protein